MALLYSPASQLPLDFPPDICNELSSMQKFPYENLSKIKRFYLKDPQLLPTEEILNREFVEKGMGGTCFSLTYHLKLALQAKGYLTEYIMGDKSQQKNVHCALKYNHHGKSYLLDPGYMVYIPIEIPQLGNTISVQWDPNDITLKDTKTAVLMYTGVPPQINLRFSLRKEYISENQFFNFWRDTFHFPMMNYPVLNRLNNGVQYYLQKNMLIERSRMGSLRTEIDPANLANLIHEKFGLDYDQVQETLKLLVVNKN